MEGNNPHLPGTKDEFIRDNMGLVYSICKNFSRIVSTYRATIDYDDLYSVGAVGLVKAYNRFDPTKFEGVVMKFSTYAVPIIEGEVRRFFRDSNVSAKFSRKSKDNFFKMKSLGLLEEEPEVVSKKLDITVEAVHKALFFEKAGLRVDYLEQPAFCGGESNITLLDTLTLQEHTDFDGSLIVREFLDTLNEKEKQVAILKFYHDRTQTEVSKILHTSQAQISRLINKVLDKAEEYGKGIMKKPKRTTIPEIPEDLSLEDKVKLLCRETDLKYEDIGKLAGCSKATAFRIGKSERNKGV